MARTTLAKTINKLPDPLQKRARRVEIAYHKKVCDVLDHLSYRAERIGEDVRDWIGKYSWRHYQAYQNLLPPGPPIPESVINRILRESYAPYIAEQLTAEWPTVRILDRDAPGQGDGRIVIPIFVDAASAGDGETGDGEE